MKQQKTTDVARMARRKTDAVDRQVRRYRTKTAKLAAPQRDSLRIIPLGGQAGIGEKNMIVLEYGDDAIVLDAGFDLGIDIPGVNYAVPATDYLRSIAHKLRGYVISHGHMDHIGGLIHIVPHVPAPIFGSRFTIGMVQAQFEKANETGLTFAADTRVLDMDQHERVQLGILTIELVRVTHSIPESSAIVVDTPAGRVINTGDFRLDPEPLDKLPTDIARLRQLGDDGVLLLMSESTNTTRTGRTPTEHTLRKSFETIIREARGRVFVSIFSTNMNRVQMIVDAAAQAGRNVALDGRSMMTVAELAVRLGNLKVPRGVLIPLRQATSTPDNKLVVICTGGQGEPGAAMSRMAAGEHPYIKLKKGDSVVISSTPIPGNDRSYQQMGDDLASLGVTQFRHPTYEIDGAGPLHVSGHGNRDEHADMIKLTRPTYLMPIYGGALNRQYHRDVGLASGLASSHIIMADNGDVVRLDASSAKLIGKVTAGSLLVDQTGAMVPEIVTKDRLLLQHEGFIVAMVTLDKQTGRLCASPDIITRGVLSIRDNTDLIETLRQEIRRVMATQRATKADFDTLRQMLRDSVAAIVHAATGHLPIVIGVVNVVGARGTTNYVPKPVADVHA
jgi:ribonuclease J